VPYFNQKWGQALRWSSERVLGCLEKFEKLRGAILGILGFQGFQPFPR
jgi:hypothetical protein